MSAWPHVDGVNRLLVWVCLMGAAVTALHLRPRPTAPARLDLPGFDPASVEDVVLHRGEDRLVLRRSFGGWTYDDGLGRTGEADPAAIEAFFARWSRPIRSDRNVGRYLSDVHLAALGLGREDTLRLYVERAGDRELLSLELGVEAPGGGHFVREEGLGAVFVADIELTAFETDGGVAWDAKRPPEPADPQVAEPPADSTTAEPPADSTTAEPPGDPTTAEPPANPTTAEPSEPAPAPPANLNPPAPPPGP